MKSFKVLVISLSLAVCGALYYGALSHQVNAQTAKKLKLSDPLPENLFIELARVVNPSVVNISVSILPNYAARNQQRPRDPFFDYFEQFLGPQMPQQTQQASGTGFIIRKDGLILTNNHVVENADIIKVQLASDESKQYEAELIGRDQRTDVALIKIKTKDSLPVAELGTSADLQVGEWVMAIGNPFGHTHSVTKGIISAIGREIGEINRFPFIQTDASINPGNSGGPLVNTKGQVIGVNSAIDARAQGIGFAIPIDEVKSILPVLEKEGRIRRAFLGVNMYPYLLDPRQAKEVGLNTTEGALIIGVLDNSAAEKAGLREYDLVIKIADKKVTSSEELSRAIMDLSVGKTYSLEYIRNGKKVSSKVTLADHPNNEKDRAQKKLSYQGQKAPFTLGFSIANYSQKIVRGLGIIGTNRPSPIVIDIETDSPAARSGLSVGDIIVDVNRVSVRQDIDVLKNLKKNQINSLRILRAGRPYLIYINPKTE